MSEPYPGPPPRFGLGERVVFSAAVWTTVDYGVAVEHRAWKTARITSRRRGVWGLWLYKVDVDQKKNAVGRWFPENQFERWTPQHRRPVLDGDTRAQCGPYRGIYCPFCHSDKYALYSAKHRGKYLEWE